MRRSATTQHSNGGIIGSLPVGIAAIVRGLPAKVAVRPVAAGLSVVSALVLLLLLVALRLGY